MLAEIYAGALQAKGVKVDKKLNIGSRETYIPALQGRLDRPDPGVHRRAAAVLQQDRHGHRAPTTSTRR